MKLFPLPLACLLATHLIADEPIADTREPGLNSTFMQSNTLVDCGDAPNPIRFTIRHIEANGIGYDEGYTTLDGFFTPIHPHQWFGIREDWNPFLDARYHEFNNGSPALNAGVGLRRETEHILWGMNAYYDFRKTKRFHYNQFALGVEALGRIWDFRINGYLPVGDTISEGYGTHDTTVGQTTTHSTRYEYALKSFNIEAGIHLSEFRKARERNTYNARPHLYFALGPYYLNGHGHSSWGGQGRIVMDIYEYIRLEANTSYDNLFHWIGQGQFSVIIPMGAKKKIRVNKGDSCQRAMMWNERALQRVDRAEIIPVKHKRKKTVAVQAPPPPPPPPPALAITDAVQ